MLTVMAEYSVMCAVASGKGDLVAAAVAKGCKLDETDYQENSSLHLAAQHGSVDIVRMLLKAGADVAAENEVHRHVLSLALLLALVAYRGQVMCTWHVCVCVCVCVSVSFFLCMYQRELRYTCNRHMFLLDCSDKRNMCVLHMYRMHAIHTCFSCRCNPYLIKSISM